MQGTAKLQRFREFYGFSHHAAICICLKTDVIASHAIMDAVVMYDVGASGRFLNALVRVRQLGCGG